MELKPGLTLLSHKTFGVGKFLKIENELIWVDFDDYGRKSLTYPDVIDNGSLKEYIPDKNESLTKDAVQINSTDSISKNENIITGQKITATAVFNESFTVVGNIEIDGNIVANYDLNVIGDIEADVIEVRKSLTVRGDIVCSRIVCNESIVCTGKIRCETLRAGEDIIAESVETNNVHCDNLIVQTTAEFEEEAEVENSIVACEGVISPGDIRTRYCYVVDYFDCDGDVSGDVYEASSETTLSTAPVPVINTEPATIETKIIEVEKQYSPREYAVKWKESVPKLYDELTGLDESKLCAELEKLKTDEPNRITDILYVLRHIIKVSYLSQIENYFDYLVIAAGRMILPQQLKEYDTVDGVFTYLLDDETLDPTALEFTANSVWDFQFALWVCENFPNELGMPPKDAIRKIFSSIGLTHREIDKLMNGGI